MPTLHVHLLGDFNLVYDGATLTSFFQGRLQALLAYLLLHRHTPQARQRLAFLFWPDSLEPQARNNLRQLLHYLRQALPDADRFVQVETKTVQWRPEAPYTLDVVDLEDDLAQAAREAEQGHAAAERVALESAVARYRGELLPGCYDEWILPERERLRKALLVALQRLIVLAEAQRNYAAAIDHAERLLRHDPLHEITYRSLMRLHALRGERARALRVYHTCATLLKRELGVEPGAETEVAYRRLLNVADVAMPHAINVARLTLVGRHDAWQALLRAWRRASPGDALLALIAGEAGIGKTRLAEEFLGWAEQQGIHTTRTQAYAAEGQPAFAPLVDLLRSQLAEANLSHLSPIWLAELSRLMPELAQPRPSESQAMSDAARRQRLFQALARAILGKRDELILFLDNLQWCDADTLAWLHYFLNVNAQARLLVMGAVRLEELRQKHPLAQLLPELRRHDMVTDIILEPLNAVDTAALAEELAGRELGIEEIAALFRYTEGNPLFIVETMRARRRTGSGSEETYHAAVPTPTPFAATMPRKLHALIQGRLNALSPAALELAGMAAVIGRVFTAEVLALASESEEEALVRALDELWRRRIVREQGSNAYDFSHDRIREAAYAQLSTARRGLYHRRVAAAMEQVYVANLDAYCGQIAAHYERAGRNALAAAYYVRAAMTAQRSGSENNATVFLRRALSNLPGMPDDAGNDA